MATSVYFNKGTNNEQYLYEDLIVEQLKVFGHDVYYLPRTLIKEDTLFGEDVLSKFDDAYGIEMFMEQVEGYGGEKELVSKFGLEIRDEATFVVSRRRWISLIGQDSNLIVAPRPNEGDLIYFPRLQKLFEINFVDHDDPFFQVDNLPVYKLYCSTFEYSSEQLDTGIAAIDVIEDESSLDVLFYQISLEQTSDYNEEMALEDGYLLLEETDGDNILSETESGGNSLITEYGDYIINESFVIDTIDDQATNIFIETQADSVLNFTEGNPFGEPRGGY
tara:strand:+ start:4136 stop:4966 length:831 start_codon:yes stop_codon:yes gene_type:complete